MVSCAKTDSDQANPSPPSGNDAPSCRSGRRAAWTPERANTVATANEPVKPSPAATPLDDWRLQWFSRLLGILVILCLVLALVVWWRLLS
jgi:hypothetical protein